MNALQDYTGKRNMAINNKYVLCVLFYAIRKYRRVYLYMLVN